MQAGSRMEHAPTICRVSAVAYVSISNICRTTVYFAHLYACACGEGTPPAIRRSITKPCSSTQLYHAAYHIYARLLVASLKMPCPNLGGCCLDLHSNLLLRSATSFSARTAASFTICHSLIGAKVGSKSTHLSRSFTAARSLPRCTQAPHSVKLGRVLFPTKHTHAMTAKPWSSYMPMTRTHG